MPAKSPEAIARKAQRKNEKNRRVAAEKRAKMLKSLPPQKVAELKVLPVHKITARRMMTRLPANMTKAQLREMLAQACANTAAL